MTKAKVDRLRYVGVAVPNYEEAVEYYGGIWGLTRVDGEPDVAYFAAEGSPEAVRLPHPQGGRKASTS